MTRGGGFDGGSHGGGGFSAGSRGGSGAREGGGALALVSHPLTMQIWSAVLLSRTNRR